MKMKISQTGAYPPEVLRAAPESRSSRMEAPPPEAQSAVGGRAQEQEQEGEAGGHLRCVGMHP